MLNNVAQAIMNDMDQSGFLYGFCHYVGILIVLRLSKWNYNISMEVDDICEGRGFHL